jgi:Rrf2 family protein
MAFIGNGVEYGLHCLLHLVGDPEEVGHAGVRDLAELQGVSGEYLAKLFTKLAKADLVVAAEGVRGGFRLARSADRITVHDVVEAIEGDKDFFDCQEIRARCAVFDEQPPGWATRGVCSIHAVMKSAEAAMREELKRHTLADLARRTDAKSSAGYKGQVVAWLSGRAAARRP